MSTQHIICDGCRVPSPTVYTWEYPNGWSKWNGNDFCPTCVGIYVPVVVVTSTPKPKPKPVQKVYFVADPPIVVFKSSPKRDDMVKVYNSRVPSKSESEGKVRVYDGFV